MSYGKIILAGCFLLAAVALNKSFGSERYQVVGKPPGGTIYKVDLMTGQAEGYAPGVGWVLP